jgi:hypothetical protein
MARERRKRGVRRGEGDGNTAASNSDSDRTSRALLVAAAIAVALLLLWTSGSLAPSPASVTTSPPSVATKRGAAAATGLWQPSAGSRNEKRKVAGLQILRSFQHDPHAFTQGVVVHKGRLYESTGMYGRSSVRIINPSNGAGRFNAQLSIAPTCCLAVCSAGLLSRCWSRALGSP